MSFTNSDIVRFRKTVWAYYRIHGRHTLPWRTTRQPYRILVSEVMLQQTQVERVIPYYRAWMKRYPTARALAEATLADVLISWQGLGYNRRAKMLHAAAKHLVKRVPKTAAEWEALPGVGPYTARAVAAFAYNTDSIVIETNIRTAVMHHFSPGTHFVSDTEITQVLEAALPKGRAREWYSALMDYGAHLKRSGIRLNTRTPGYAPQRAFKGSSREARGALLKALAAGPQRTARLQDVLGPKRRLQVTTQIARLVQEGMIERHGASFHLPRSG